ncbi:NAD(P)-dependent oxidoreductase [Halalkalibacter oceani]|uniref:NAD(P)-dependent oxidoreductase n=1 Tax=Halalkalibacter oceani TaxID=1653776 RepID=UPI0033922C8F
MNTILLSHTSDERKMLYSEQAIEELQRFAKIITNPHNRQLTESELIELAQEATIVITTVRAAGSKALFENAPHLTAFIRCGVDIRNIDLAAASDNNIMVCNCPGIYEAPVVELVIGYLCCISRGIVTHHQNLRQGIMERYTTPDLYHKTLGLVGYGAIAKKVAITAKTLGMRVKVFDPFVSELGSNEELVSFKELLTTSDFVSLHAVLNDETEGMIGPKELSWMKSDAWLINTGRGLLIQEDALYQALVNKKIAGAALDVFATEPDILASSLLTLDNVIVTPHIGGWSDRVYKELSMKTVEIVRTIVAGKIPETTVNKSLLSLNG